MTSKSLFSKIFWTRLGKRLAQFNWLTALWSIVLFFVFPVAGALIFSVEYRENYWTVARVSDTIVGQICFACGASVLMAILTPNAFNYLNSRKELDFYHSQPVTRKELFRRNYMVGWLSFIIPLTAGFLLEAGVIMLIPGIAWDNLFLLVKGYFACLGTYFSVNALCLLAVVLCGNRFISLLTGVYFCGAPAMLFGMFYYFINEFSATFRYEELMENILAGISPLAYVLDFAVAHSDGAAFEYLWSVIVWTVISAGVLFLARGLYLRRKSETAGKPLSFPKAILFIKYPLTVFAAWIGGLLFDAMTDSAIWMLFGAVTFGILTHCIISGLEKFEFRNAFRGWLKLLLCTGIFLTCLLLIFVGCYMFDRRTTKDENIVSIDIDRLYYSENAVNGNVYDASDLEDIRGEEAIKALNIIAKAGTESISDGYYTKNGVFTIGDNDNTAYVNLHLRINTKFGSYEREYSFNCDIDGEIWDAINDFAYSAGAKKSEAEQALARIDTQADKFAFRPTTDFTSRKKMEEVYEALKKDMAAATVKDYEADPIGFVTLTYSARLYEWSDQSELASASIPVYSFYKNTLKLAENAVVKTKFDGVGNFGTNDWYTDADYDKGYSIGYEEGYKRGKMDGEADLPYFEYVSSADDQYNRGYYEGYIMGYDQGYSMYGDSWSAGYDAGYAEGNAAGIDDAVAGYDMTLPDFYYNGTNYREAYIEGFQTGYYDGYKSFESGETSNEAVEE